MMRQRKPIKEDITNTLLNSYHDFRLGCSNETLDILYNLRIGLPRLDTDLKNELVLYAY